MVDQPSAQLSAGHVAQLIARYRSVRAGDAPTGQQTLVTSWSGVMTTLRAQGSTHSAAAVLGPGDAAPVDLGTQDEWPPACPVVATDGSWVLAQVAAGQVLLVFLPGLAG